MSTKIKKCQQICKSNEIGLYPINRLNIRLSPQKIMNRPNNWHREVEIRMKIYTLSFFIGLL